MNSVCKNLKNSLFIVLAATLFVGGQAMGMGEHKETFKERLTKAYSSHNFEPTTVDQPDIKLNRPYPLGCTSPLSLCRPAIRHANNKVQELYNLYVTIPTENMRRNSDHKAPEYVQKQACELAKAMIRPYSIKDRLLYWYLKKFGFLTVYDGHIKHPELSSWLSRLILDLLARSAGAYTRQEDGGIYFPRKSFGSQLTDDQQFSLAHEVGHNMNGDTTTRKHRDQYTKEFLAQKRAVETLFKKQAYATIAEEYKNRYLVKTLDIEKDPYYDGLMQTLAPLLESNQELKKLCTPPSLMNQISRLFCQKTFGFLECTLHGQEKSSAVDKGKNI